MAKILLFALNSSYTHTNLAVRCLKKSLSTAGFLVDIAEFNLKDKRRRMLEALAESDAEIYGFSAYIWNIGELLSLTADLRALKPDVTIFFGGPEVSYDSEEILSRNPQIDCIITGEGEEAVVALAEMHSRGDVIPRIINGDFFDDFSKQGTVYEHIRDGGSHIVYYESVRGCPYRCAFCLSALSGEVRAKSAETTLTELLSFEDQDSIKIIKFVDRTFNFDRERAKKIWRGLLSESYTKSYHFEISADLLDEESYSILSAFREGKIQLEIGLQSTNPQALDAVNRLQSPSEVIAASERLYKMGNMHIHADLICGLPHEDFESFAKSYDRLFGKCHKLQLGFLKLLRGSHLRDRAEEFGCVYSSTPPYEVLATDCLSFKEISRLHDIDDVANRYATPAFSRSMRLLLSRHGSPFYFFDNIAARLRAEGQGVAGVSQPKAYEKLFEYYGGESDCELATTLTIDFLTSQKLSPPRFGKFELVRIDAPEYKKLFMDYADRAGIRYFAPALEVRRGGNDIYIFERRALDAFLLKDDGFIKI